MNAARGSAVSLLVLVLTSAGAWAEDLAVLTVGFGEAPSALLEASVRRAATSGEVTPLENGVAAARVAERYGQPTGVDLGWVTAEVERGEEAYYTMHYAEGAEPFETDEWRAAQAALVDLAANPELAVAVRRGLMARGRSHFYAEDRERTAAAVRDAVALFPEWIPEADWYLAALSRRRERRSRPLGWCSWPASASASKVAQTCLHGPPEANRGHSQKVCRMRSEATCDQSTPTA
jgi:hypothetical protein